VAYIFNLAIASACMRHLEREGTGALQLRDSTRGHFGIHEVP